ncbi:glycosyltransferase family 4 protein [Fructobacillus parabroussonetiae]|uniref:Glycosyltransferase n=1 Tax=Fructobacillus parabroussonetiae TaxID=2713174 RepID=A0ABS5QX94_9LACO|nr:glycosyltransferase [Fructobacillus parabroussonetiae]MBS9337836.1 glycosyltransferase [Fructobacillus parabroussonetiae]MCK8617634.1 glycosyltransferase [Fructobacillus parabroussonetiae]
MKVLLYFENQKWIAQSGIGRAMRLQQAALGPVADVTVTTDPKCVDYDVLHINTYGVNSMHMVKKAHKMGKKVVYHAHSTYEDFRNSFFGSNLLAPLYKKYLVALYSRADALVTPTPYSKSLLENYGLKQPIYPVSNGIDLTKYEPDDKRIQAYKEYFDIKEGQQVVMSVGLFFERKGLFDFIELAKRHPEITFIWFGSTNLAIVPAKVREAIEHHPDNLIFPGYITGDIIKGAYAGADLFLYPSYEETEGIVVLEALASKQRLLVRDIPVYDGWLVDQENCYKASDLDDFDKQMVAILSGQQEDLTAAGYQVAKARDLHQVGEVLGQVYRATLDEKTLPLNENGMVHLGLSDHHA